MNYSDTLRRGWEITWNNKWLWLLGFLAALGGGGGFGSSSNYTMEPGNVTPGTTPNIEPEMIAAIIGGAALIFCIFTIIGILLWLVSLASKGGLITSVAELDRGEASSFGRAFRQGWRKLLPLVSMTLLLFSVVIILGIILAVSFAGTIAGAIAAVMSGESDALVSILSAAGIAFLCLLCLLFPLSIVLSFIYPFAYRGIMLRDMGVRDSIRHGWRVLRDNLGDIVLLGIIFLIVSAIISLVAFGIVGLLSIGSGLFSVIMSGGEPTTAQLVGLGVGLLATFVIFAIISAIFTAWRSATFTLGYLQWTGKDVLPE